MTPDERRAFHEKVVLGSTSNIELAAYFAGRKPIKDVPRIKFGGVFSNDELHDPKRNVIYILNLQNSDQGGSHWVLLCNGWYMDPYGTPPTKRISQFVTDWNRDEYQSLESEACGFFCLYVADRLMAGLDPFGDLKPDQEDANEDVLEAYFAG